MPRAAALLDVAQISDITEVKTADTFVRPIYAGNALATVQSSDSIKVITVRTIKFEAAAAEGGSASVEDSPALGGVEGAGFAKCVDPAGMGYRRLEHVGADEIDVVVGATLELEG